MNDKQKKLMRLVRELRFPYTDSELEKNIKGLSEEETDKLISVCGDVLAYQDMLADEARLANPEEYAKIEREYEIETEKLEKKFAKDMEKVQAEADDEMDKAEEETKKEIDATLKEMDEKLQKLEEEAEKTLTDT